ncbi:hypothetical protein MRX96_007685 [Rhipicephalus microplus]
MSKCKNSSLYIPAQLIATNDSLAVLRDVHKMGFSMPMAISFSLKGVYYSPKLSDSSSPSVDELQLFKPCQDFSTANYDDPKELCDQAGWVVQEPFPELAYNLDERRSMTYLTEERITTLVSTTGQVSFL